MDIGSREGEGEFDWQMGEVNDKGYRWNWATRVSDKDWNIKPEGGIILIFGKAIFLDSDHNHCKWLHFAILGIHRMHWVIAVGFIEKWKTTVVHVTACINLNLCTAMQRSGGQVSVLPASHFATGLMALPWMYCTLLNQKVIKNQLRHDYWRR